MFRAVAERLDGAGLLRVGTQEAADSLYAIASESTYLRMTEGAGPSADRYGRWLTTRSARPFLVITRTPARSPECENIEGALNVGELNEQPGRVLLRMYVASDSAPSAQARRQLAALRERLGGEHWEVEIVDVFEQPGLAEADRILATPVLIRMFPEPRLSVIGDFSDSDAVAVALDLEKAKDR